MHTNNCQSFEEFIQSLEPKFDTESATSVLYYLLKNKDSTYNLNNAFDEYFKKFAAKTVTCDYIYGGSRMPASNIIPHEHALRALFVELVKVDKFKNDDVQTFVNKYVNTLYSRMNYANKNKTIYADAGGMKVAIRNPYYRFPVDGMYFYDAEILLAMTNELALRKLNLNSIKKAIAEIPFTVAKDATHLEYSYRDRGGISNDIQKQIFDENIRKIKEIITNPELAKPNLTTPKEQKKINKIKAYNFKKTEKKYNKKTSLLKRIFGRGNDLEI